MTGCSSEGVGVGIVVRARPHDRHLIDGEPLSSDCEDRGRAGCWDRERVNRRSGHQSLAIRAPRVLAKGLRTQLNSTTEEEYLPMVTCGIDWAQDHHDIAIVDADGRLIAKRRIPESVAGFTDLTAMLADAGDDPENPIPVAIETPRGLLVAVLRASGRLVYPIQPHVGGALPGADLDVGQEV